MSAPSRDQSAVLEKKHTTEILSHAQNCHFDRVDITVTQADSKSGLDIGSLLNPITDASHTRNLTTSPPNSSCFPGTRKEVISNIDSWAKSTVFSKARHILWVLGYAGCGKSAIALAVAFQLAEKRRLGASFFFFRGSGDRSRVVRFAATLASQIAANIPGTAQHIEAALRVHPGLLKPTTSLVTQLRYLVYDPIRAVTAKWYRPSGVWKPFIIVVDGLDECEDKQGGSEFVKSLIEFFEQKPDTPLRFLITSRVEDHLHSRLHDSNQVRLLNLVDHTSDSDIAAALDAAIEEGTSSRVLPCDGTWPSAEDRRKLVQHIGGSFIFMKTITQFLFDPHRNDGLTPIERLPLALEMNPGFDGLYTEILKGSRYLPHFLDIVSTIALVQEPVSIAQLADLLRINVSNVANVLVSLHAIFQVPGDDYSPVTLWHTSLRDFLTSKSRAGELFASPRHHLPLAFWYIAMSSPSASPSGYHPSLYSEHYAGYHWNEFLDPVKGGASLTKDGLDGIITLLEKTFPDQLTDLHIVAATCFHLDHRFFYGFSLNIRNGAITSLIRKLYPQTVAPDELLLSLLSATFDAIRASPAEEEIYPQLQLSFPKIFDPSHHLDMVIRGIHVLVKSRASDGALMLHSGRRSPADRATEYMFICWPRHLALAMQLQPKHPIFDEVQPTRFSIQESSEKRAEDETTGQPFYVPPYLHSEQFDWLVTSNLALANNAIKATAESKAVVDQRVWDWDTCGRFVHEASDSSVTVYEVLSGIHSLLSCFQATCNHDTPGGQCLFRDYWTIAH